MEEIKIKYADKGIDKIDKIEIGNWIDLRSAETVEIQRGDFKLISLGVAIKIPDGYEAYLAPRSSTFKNYGILQTNSIGIIDSSYCGDNDIWKFPAYATKDTVIHKNDRICQFRIMKNMPEVKLISVENLDAPDRGGFGSTGIK